MAVQIQIDDRIRLVASVLLLTKFANENSGWKPHLLKTLTTGYLETYRDHPCAIVSREIADSQWMSAFYCYAVLLDQELSSFVLRWKAVITGYNTNYMKCFEERRYSDLLRCFYEDTEIGLFWDRTDDLWHEIQHDCQRCLQKDDLDEFLELFFGVLPYQMVFVPNPVDPPTFGFGPSDGVTAYCIVGPPAIPLDSDDSVRYERYGHDLAYLAFHEFTHSLWDDLRKQYPDFIEKVRSLGTTMSLRGWFPRMYPTWEEQFDEIFIRAATALYHEQLEGEASALAMLNNEKEKFGIDIIDCIFWCLRQYLTARKCGDYHNLGEYLPVLSEKLIKQQKLYEG